MSDLTDWNTDLLVLGAGMAGMTAAARAAQLGARVLVVEKASTIGGSTVLSGGRLWTGADLDLLAEECPLGDPELQQVAFEGFDDAVAFLRSTGVQVGPRIGHLHYGKGHDFDVVGYIQACRTLVEQQGGTVALDTVTDRLEADGEDRVTGALLLHRDGRTRVQAHATLLATGGFAANPDLLRSFVHPNGTVALARANPLNTGDGLRLGLEAGGSTSPFMGGFYGHVIQSPARQWGPREFRAYTQGASIKSLLLNREGARFCDESLGDHQNSERILEQTGARALMVFDENIRRTEATLILANTDTPIDKVRIAIEEGARVASGATWKEVFAATAGWGFDAERCLATVAAFNGTETPDPPRRRDRLAYVEPPFYAMEVQCGVTATHGGLRIDSRARALDAFGSPVPGLFVAGADAGNAFGEGYGGGLNFAATLGLIAAGQVKA